MQPKDDNWKAFDPFGMSAGELALEAFDIDLDHEGLSLGCQSHQCPYRIGVDGIRANRVDALRAESPWLVLRIGNLDCAIFARHSAFNRRDIRDTFRIGL